MHRTERTSAWERLLGEPIAAVSSVRIDDGSAFRGTVVLTATRFLAVRRSFTNRPPRTPGNLEERLRMQFLRSNITEISPSPQQRRGDYDVRYYDGLDGGGERKFRIIPGRGTGNLIEQMEGDLSDGA